MKKLLMAFSVAVVTLLCSISVFAAETDDSRTWEYQAYGSGVELTKYNGTQTDVYIPSKITKGDAEYSVIKLGDELFKDNTSLNSVTLGEGIIEIGASAFEGTTNLVCIVTPESLSSIGANAFSGCTNFNSVILYNNVISIGENAFSDCSKLTIYCEVDSVAHQYASDKNIKYVLISDSATPTLVTIDGVSYYVGNGEVIVISCDREKTGNVVIPSEIDGFPVTEITESAFSECSGITSVRLPQTIKYIGKKAFYYCTSLTSINIPSGVTEILENTFDNAALSYISMPMGITRIESRAFLDTNISSIYLPSTLNYIGAQAFCGCSNLRTITIPEGVTKLGVQTFAYCYHLNNVVLPQSLTYVGEKAFQSCNNMTDIYYNGSQKQWAAITKEEPYVFGSAEIHYAIETPIIPVESVTIYNTERDVFVGQTVYVTAVVSPSSADDRTVTWSSDNTDVATVDERGRVTVISAGKAVITVTTNDGGHTATCTITATYPHGEVDGIKWSIDADGVLEISGEGAIADYSDTTAPWNSYGSTVKKIVVKEGITRIGKRAFYTSGAQNVILPDSVQEIGSYAFGYMRSLVELSVSKAVTVIEDHAFCGCTAMLSIDFGAAVSTIGEGAFVDCSALESISMSEDNLYYATIDNVLYDHDITRLICYPRSRKNTQYTVPETVVTIPDSTFQGSKYVEEVIFTKNIKTFGERVFFDCKSIKVVVFQNDMDILPNYTFYGCSSLSNVTLSKSVTAIGENAFRECSSLENIILSDGIKTVGRSAFYNCISLRSITFSQSIETIEYYAFYNCKNLAEITFPASLKTLKDYCFSQCTSLETINIHEGLESLGICFSGCTSLKTITLPVSLTYVDPDFLYKSSIIEIYFKGPQNRWLKICQAQAEDLGNVSMRFEENIAVEGITLNKTELQLGIYGMETLSYEFTPKYPNNVNVIWKSSNENVATVVDGVVTTSSSGTAVISVITEDGGYESKCTVTVTDSYDVLYQAKNGNTSWVIYNNGYMIIKGKGNIANYEIGTGSFPYWRNYSDHIRNVIIEEGITNINKRAFYDCGNLVSISIPSTVTEICDDAFNGCTLLKGLVLPDAVESIGTLAFADCKSLESIRIPNNIKSIDRMAFTGCNKLKDVYVDSLEVWCNMSLGGTSYDNALYYAENLYVGNKKIKNVVVPNTVTSISNYLFSNSDIESVIIPSSVKDIGNSAFEGCHYLKKVVLSEGLETIGEKAFTVEWSWDEPSMIGFIVIPKSVTSIAADAFEYNTFLYVYKDSYAHRFAVENRYLYFVLPDRLNPEISYGKVITGTAKYTDGTVASGTTVEILYDDGTIKETVTTDATGNYEFTYVEVGRYTIRVTDSDGNTASEVVSVKRMNAFDVYLAGETDLVLKKGYAVSGTVTPATSKVTISDTNGNVIKSVDTTSGTFTFTDIPRGTYIVKAENNNGSITTEIYVSNEDVTGIALEIKAQSATITGDIKIENRDGTFTSKIWVDINLIDADGNVIASTKTDAEGKYTFNNVPAGKYNIIATTNEMRPDVIGGFDKSHELKGYGLVDVTDFVEYAVDTIILREEKVNLTAVSGKVTANGITQDCEVILTDENGDQIAVFITDNNGKYNFINIPDGMYCITAITKVDGMGFAVITIKDGVVYGDTDIKVAKADKISKREETLLKVPDCSTKEEALLYKEAILTEKRFYDSLSDKERKQLSKEWIEKLFKLFGLIIDSNIQTPTDVIVENEESIISSDEIDKTIEFVLSVTESTAVDTGEDGITTDEEYETEKIKDKKGKDKKIAKYYDLTFSKDGQNISNIQKQTETNGKLRITMDIPQEYRGHKHYSFIHMHKGEAVTLVDLDDNPNTVTFEIDKFSTFALAYSDVELIGEVEETAYPASISYNSETGKISVTSTQAGKLYIATYNGIKLENVESFNVPVGTTNDICTLNSNQFAFVWDENLRPLCEQVTISE